MRVLQFTTPYANPSIPINKGRGHFRRPWKAGARRRVRSWWLRTPAVSPPARSSMLAHAVTVNDTLILLHVEIPSPWKNPVGSLMFKFPISPGPARLGGIGSYSSSDAECASGAGDVDFLDEMKRACMAAKPRMNVVVEKAEVADGKDKAAAIVAHSAACNVDLLIIGQRKNTLLSKSLIASKRGLSLKAFETADYAIENSKCACIAVQKKGNRGYLLNSKTHKNYWLLA